MSEESRRSFLKKTALAASVGAVAGTSAATADLVAEAPKGAVFMAGVAVRDVTPPLGAPLWGYSDAIRAADGVLDPLEAKALVFRVVDTSLGLVVIDFGRVPGPAAVQRIRERAVYAGIDQVVLMATHTHSAPFVEIPDASYLLAIENGIVEALLEAAKDMEPVQVGVGRTTIDIAHNRRVIKDGKCYMLWRNAERRPTSPLDREVGVIRFDTLAGKPLATLVNYACHPVVFGPDNLKYSSDWPGEMCRVVEEETGSICLFAQGGCGDINPYLDKTPLAEGGVEAMHNTGRTAGEAVLKVFGDIAMAAPAAPGLAYREVSIPVGCRYDLDDDRQAAVLKEVYGPMYDLYLKPFAEKQAVPMGALVLNGNLALAFMPGEFFVQLQKDLKAGSPVPDTFLMGYANEFHAYFPTIRDAAIGGYGGLSASYVGVGAGEKLVAAAQTAIGELAGRFDPISGAEDFEVLEM